MTFSLLELLIAAKKNNLHEKLEILSYNLKNLWAKLEKSLHTIWKIIQIEKLELENWYAQLEKFENHFIQLEKLENQFIQFEKFEIYSTWKIGTWKLVSST